LAKENTIKHLLRKQEL